MACRLDRTLAPHEFAYGRVAGVHHVLLDRVLANVAGDDVVPLRGDHSTHHVVMVVDSTAFMNFNLSELWRRRHPLVQTESKKKAAMTAGALQIRLHRP